MTFRALKILVAAAALTTTFVTASAASAATITINQTYDITKANPSTSTSFMSFNNIGFTPLINSLNPVTLQNGDTLDVHLTFLTGQSIQLTNFLGGLQTDLFNGSTGSFSQASGVLKLFDTNGNLIISFDTATNPFFLVNGGVGQDFVLASTPLNATIGSLEFIDTNVSGEGSGTNFIGDLISFNAQSGSILAISAVPEPATWTTMLAGFFGIGTVLRYQRRRRLVLAQLA